MKISKSGLQLIKDFEGCRLRAYQCSANVWTIGYGHTHKVHPGDCITQEEAEQLLAKDIKLFEGVVNRLVKVSLTQNQFDALVSFVFNLGEGNLSSSTLLKHLNSGDYLSAANELPRWVNAGGKKIPGLVRRRNAERLVFMKDMNSKT
ncbi:TPA: lysozyme [Enterobacter cloacae]